MRKYSILSLLFISGMLAFRNDSCKEQAQPEGTQWPPDTIRAVHTGGSTYMVVRGLEMKNAQEMTVTFSWPPDTISVGASKASASETAMKCKARMGQVQCSALACKPSPWPPDTTHFPSEIILVIPKRVSPPK